jgi:hypothetical protein
MPNINANKNSTQCTNKTMPQNQCEFRAHMKTGTGPDKNGIEITFTDDPPLEIIATLSANNFHYQCNTGVWYSKSTSHTKQIAEYIIEKGLLPKPICPKVGILEVHGAKPYRAAHLMCVSEKIITPMGKYHQAHRDAIIKAIEIIGMVHQIDASFSPIPVKIVKECDGYAALFNPNSLEILVCKIEPPRVLTIVHEVGHYLDDSLGERINKWREKLIQAIKRTKGYKKLKNFDINGSGVLVVTSKNGVTRRNVPLRKLDPGLKYRIEACDDIELFARGYEQYIGIKTGACIDEIESENEYRLDIINGKPINKAIPLMWKLDDFQEVESVLDEMFTEIGWGIIQNNI